MGSKYPGSTVFRRLQIGIQSPIDLNCSGPVFAKLKIQKKQIIAQLIGFKCAVGLPLSMVSNG